MKSISVSQKFKKKKEKLAHTYLFIAVVNIDPRFSCVEPHHTKTACRTERVHVRYRAVERHRVVQLVFKHVQVVEAVRVRITVLWLIGVKELRWDPCIVHKNI